MPMRASNCSLFALLSLILASCSSSSSAVRPPASQTASSEIFYSNLGTHRRTVTTRPPLAQRLFDQGLVLAYAFNHDEAIRAFTAATRENPDCAMAYWNIALVNGPHINNPAMDESHVRTAWEALTKARAIAPGASAIE